MRNGAFEKNTCQKAVQVHGSGESFPHPCQFCRCLDEESHPLLSEQNLIKIPQRERNPILEQSASAAGPGPVYGVEQRESGRTVIKIGKELKVLSGALVHADEALLVVHLVIREVAD